MADFSEVLEKALGLDIDDRAALAERLLASLDELSVPESDRLWAEEASRRRDALRAGLAKGIPAEEVHRKAQKLFR
ncbi:MAG: addiction module protein [Acidobacteriia bacterium]|nr:addiction module protein [Terriglobia bacterium]